MAIKRARLKLILINVLMSLAVSSAADIDFVGSDRCASCHEDAMVDWKQSDHYRAMAPLSLSELIIMTELLVMLMIIEVTCVCINMTPQKLMLLPTNLVQPLDLSAGRD